MLATSISFVPAFLRGLKKPRGSLCSNSYSNPYVRAWEWSKARAWALGRDPNDINGNPYPEESELWHAWQEGDSIRKRVETRNFRAR
jgi:hypothetical protein